jgi:hypothetical protein
LTIFLDKSQTAIERNLLALVVRAQSRTEAASAAEASQSLSVFGEAPLAVGPCVEDVSVFGLQEAHAGLEVRRRKASLTDFAYCLVSLGHFSQATADLPGPFALVGL